MRVLVVEDHPKLALALQTGLREAGMAVDVAFDGEDALARTTLVEYDVLVLDRDIPRVNGDEVCRRLARERRLTRILMLTAARDVEARVEGLGLGADDYLGKPFDFKELVARIRALARRSQPALPPKLIHGDLRLDTARRTVTRAGEQIALGPKELGVLELLLAADGAVVSAETLLERVWDDAMDPFSHVVRITISRLRAKLGDPPLIHTVPTAGYRI